MDQAGGGVQDPVTPGQFLGSALARSPSRASSLSQASRMAAIMDAASHAALMP